MSKKEFYPVYESISVPTPIVVENAVTVQEALELLSRLQNRVARLGISAEKEPDNNVYRVKIRLYPLGEHIQSGIVAMTPSGADEISGE